MRRRNPAFLVSIALAGCYSSPPFEDYYAEWDPPTVSGLDVSSEPGNGGGTLVTISGSGFGDSLDDVLVMVGKHNAEVLSVTPSAIQIRTPIGPVTGGPLSLLVATETGYVEVPDAYTYDMGALSGDSNFYDEQTSYILVQNLWNSCYGGMMTNPSIGGCETIAYYGDTGLDGRSEFLRFIYPRIHTAYQGFITGFDATPAEWTVHEAFDTPSPEYQGVEDLRYRVPGDFMLRNPEFLGQEYCYDLAGEPVDGKAPNCEGTDVRHYDKGILRFCEGDDAEEGPDFKYSADWPVIANFFKGPDGDFEPAEILVDVPELGLENNKITVPGLPTVIATEGFTEPDYWTVADMNACPDSDGDGQAMLDEDGIVLSWEPIEDPAVLEGGDNVVQVTTYWHISMTFMNIGWFLGDGYGVRASIVVPDDANYDEFTGLASVGIPNSVLYQFPTPNLEWAAEIPAAGIGHLGTIDSNASYLIIEALRVTEYVIELPGAPQGSDLLEPGAHAGEHLVFSYVNGDLSFPMWKNPLDNGSNCADCLDGDGDGWADGMDPDCIAVNTCFASPATGGSGDEGTTTSLCTCNDGVDNDNDGDIDAEDDDCANGADGETNCGDGIDNDGDGWIDMFVAGVGGDGECTGPNSQELGNDDVAWTCADGLDQDVDGWFDAEDPDCVDGQDTEVGGFGTTECNDGINNDDVDGLIDADDPWCAASGHGATWESETPPYSNQCADNTDNESPAADGFVDEFDPDCEYQPTRENRTSHDPATYPLTTECYDGIDNDADGTKDGFDPGCWDPLFGFVANGFLLAEDTNNGTPCSDGLDNDADGWFDGEDPDCVRGDPANQTEDGFGSTQCNDGIDNDTDLHTDADDTACLNALDNNEGS